MPVNQHCYRSDPCRIGVDVCEHEAVIHAALTEGEPCYVEGCKAIGTFGGEA